MKNIFLILTSIFLLSCSNRNSEVEDCHSLLNSLIKSCHLESYIIVNEPTKFEFVKKEDPFRPPSLGKVSISDYELTDLENDKILTKVDIRFIMEQLKGKEKFNWDSTKIKNTVIDKSEIDSVTKNHQWYRIYKYLFQKYKKSRFANISKPLFSKDRKISLITIETHCGGLCGEGTLYVCEKTGTSWKILKTFNLWIS